MKNRILFIAVLFLAAFSLKGQQTPFWMQNETYGFISNPAMIAPSLLSDGDDMILFNALYRNQWAGFENAPETFLAGAQFSLPDASIRFGGSILNDQFGPLSQTQLRAFYAYQISFDRWSRHQLSFGVSGQFSNFIWDASSLDIDNPNDQLIGSGRESKFKPDVGIGIWYSNVFENGFDRSIVLYAGLSVEQLLSGRLDLQGNAGEIVGMERVRHFHANAGMRFYQFGSEDDFVEIFAQASQVLNAPILAVVGANVSFLEEKFVLGVGLSTDFQLRLRAQVEVFEDCRISYSNQSFLNGVTAKQVGFGHELVLSYLLRT